MDVEVSTNEEDVFLKKKTITHVHDIKCNGKLTNIIYGWGYMWSLTWNEKHWVQIVIMK